jgi:hypothetical protein
MLRVLRHYLPLRRALLVFSETVVITAVLAAGMTWHLLKPTPTVLALLTQSSLSLEGARLRCLISAFLLTLLSQFAISFNELYDFRISTSRFDRASRFVGSTGSAIAVALSAVLLARVWELSRVFDFPGMPLSQLVQTLVFTMLAAFGILYLWRGAFHFVLRKWNFNARVLILGAGDQARSLAREMLERPDSGYEAIGLIPEAETPVRKARAEGTPPAILERSGYAARNGGGNGDGHKPAGATLLLEPIPLTAGTQALETRPQPKPLTESLFDLVLRMDVDVVVVALEDRRGHLPVEELLRCRLAGIAVREREALYELITAASRSRRCARPT